MQTGQAGQKDGHLDGVTVNMVSWWMMITARELTEHTPSETVMVRLNVMDVAVITRFCVLITPMLSITKLPKNKHRKVVKELLRKLYTEVSTTT